MAMTVKNVVSVGAGAVGAAVSYVAGGWNSALAWLLIFMAMDYISGLVVAGVFKNSPKSESGRLDSQAGLKGLIRKGGMLALVLIGYGFDNIIGVQYVQHGVIYALMTNEVVSLLENIGLMGVPMPRILTSALEVLHKNADLDELTEHDVGGDKRNE